MKLALRYIPTEVWVDVICYPWITRERLGKIVHKFRNRYFAEILQYCLHERGSKHWAKCIWISHFDSSALAFLRNISTLFIDVNLHFKFFDDLTKLRTILGHLSPLLQGIHSMKFMRNEIPMVEQYFSPKLAQVKMLTIQFGFDQHDQASVNFCLNWLVSEERNPAEPRLLKVHIYCADNVQQFCTAIKQQFRSAKSPCTFAIGFFCYGNNHHNADFHLKNNLGEQLYGQFNKARNFMIVRHKVKDSARDQLQEWVYKAVDKSDRSKPGGIEFYGSATIGQIEENADPNEMDVNAGDEADQPIHFEEA